jgi:hypothetical protein
MGGSIKVVVVLQVECYQEKDNKGKEKQVNTTKWEHKNLLLVVDFSC